MENLIIVGTGTNARHVYEFVKMYKLYNIIGFAVNRKFLKDETFYNLPVYPLEELEDCVKVTFKVFIALLWNRLNKDRRDLFEYCESKGYEFANIISPHAVIRSSSHYGRNCWFHDFVVVQNDTKIGDDVSVMAFSLISSNCKVGSHSFFGARSILGGGSSVGMQTFVGFNATIFDCTKIGNKCIIGACTAVKRNMPSFSKCNTPSDNIVIKQYNESEIENKLVASLNKR